MKHYPSITKEINPDINVWAFDKLDGSQIRAEWSKKQGFYKFGSKTQLLGEDNPILGEAIELINTKYSSDLIKKFQVQKYERAVCFFEYFGENSFAGWHNLCESHDVILFDVAPHKCGILPPDQFIKLFGDLDIPKVLYYGKANSMFIKQVRSGTLPDMTLEGVVCKGKVKHGNTIMFKIKNQEWLDRLKRIYGHDLKKFEELS